MSQILWLFKRICGLNETKIGLTIFFEQLHEASCFYLLRLIFINQDNIYQRRNKQDKIQGYTVFYSTDHEVSVARSNKLCRANRDGYLYSPRQLQLWRLKKQYCPQFSPYNNTEIYNRVRVGFSPPLTIPLSVVEAAPSGSRDHSSAADNRYSLPEYC